MYQNYYYRVNNWDTVLHSLQQSLLAEEMVCATSSELFHIPDTKNLKGNNEMHTHLVPAFYHRVTAVGSAYRLKNGEERPTIVQTMTTCIINAENQDKEVRKGLNVMAENATEQWKPFIAVIIQWQAQAESTLKQAKDTLIAMGVSFPSASEEQDGGTDSY
jgi:hypothetical protein